MIGRFFFVLFLAFFFTFKAIAHPVHVSVVNIDITNGYKIHFSVKIFTDDFQTVLSQVQNKAITINSNAQLNLHKELITKYIYNNLSFKIETRIPESFYHIEKMEIKEDAVWIFFDIIPNQRKFDQIEITNTLMCDLYHDQTNLLILSFHQSDMAYRYQCKSIVNKFKLN